MTNLESRDGNRLDRAKAFLNFGLEMRKRYAELPERLAEAKQIPVPDIVTDALELQRNAIQEIYGTERLSRHLLFHGTGALQYEGQKYSLGTSQTLRYPADNILTDGINPHVDPWIVKKNESHSVSLATARQYAKWFADRHQSTDNPLAWEFGDSAEWFMFYMYDTILMTKVGLKDIKDIGGYLKRARSTEKPRLNRLQQWINDIRDDITPSTDSMNILTERTTIPQNHGVIFSMDGRELDLFDMGLGGVYEQRTAENIPPEKYKSIEVPLSKVEEYQEKVHRLGLTIPVLATEAVELYISQFPLDQLTKAARVKQPSITLI